jgi:photosystem II stability/assembly factor-like uncharacterized protein
MRALLTILGGALVALGLVACGGDEGESEPGASFVENASHIHGLGINPADQSLFIATHSGLYRSPRGSSTALPVGQSTQDTMGFSVAGPDHFFGSGHPGPGEDGPPNLGLIESEDGGRSWREVSLGGQADFHVLRYAGERIYGFNGLSGLLMVSSDGGQTWEWNEPPTGLLDVAVDPADPDHLIGVSDLGLIESRDRGKSWERQSEAIGYLAWPVRERLYLFDGDAGVSVSRDHGKTFRAVGRLPDVPVAVLAPSDREVYAAMHDGTVLASRDGGASWAPRVSTNAAG